MCQGFWINGNDVEVLYSPIQFYQTLLKNISLARERIVLCALYIQDEELMKLISEKKKQNKNLKVTIVMDSMRGKNCTKENVVLYEHPRSKKFHFFPKLAEIVAVQHVKLYAFDDKVIISGANLSSEYFSRRQDRYIQITNQKVANHYVKIVENLGTTIPIFDTREENHDTLIVPRELYVDCDKMYFSTAYFNPTPRLKKILRNAEILVPSLESTGFYKKFNIIPYIYSHFIHQFNQKTMEKTTDLHAKGIWFGNKGTIIGSSNFNYRSEYRDLELQTTILTTNQTLQQKLKKERLLLWENSRPFQYRSCVFCKFFCLFKSFF